MYSKYLFVGLGGSGGKTLRFLKREILRWMDSHGAGTRIPSAWQFLHIDTPTVPDGEEITIIAPRLDDDEYMGLINAGMNFRALTKLLDGNPNLRRELRTWRVEPAGLGVPLEQGAGQMRAIGQSVAMAYAGRIRERLEEHVRRITRSSARGELAELFNLVEDQRAASESAMYIVVVSSLAGGTGAGLLNLVCDILRAMDTPAGDAIFAILYTPEVFHSLGRAASGGVHPNSLAALCEMLNGQWWHGGDADAATTAEPRRSPVLVGAGLPRPQTRSGPTFPFLVGRVAEGGIDYGTPDRLFETVGRSLLSWISDMAVQSRFVAYTSGNWHQSAENQEQGPILVNAGHPHEQGLPCFSALGFSRLSVGTEHFERYAMQRLAKDALGHLTRYHTDSDEARSLAKAMDSSDPEVIVHEIATVHRPAFLHDLRLTEVGPDDNELCDDLMPPSHEELIGRMVDRAYELAGIVPGAEADAVEWRRLVCDAVREAQTQYEAEYRGELAARVAAWIPAAGERVLRAVRQRIASHGLLVTAELCSQVLRYLAHDVKNDLIHNDLDRYRQWSDHYAESVHDALETAGKKVRDDDQRLVDAVNGGVNAASYIGNALVCEKAAELAGELADRVFTPLVRTLREAHAAAEADMRQAVSYPDWNDESPSREVRPPAGDFSLIDPDKYPEEFLDLLSETIGPAVPDQQKREAVRIELISGGFLDGTAGGQSHEALPCLVVERDWWPATGLAGSQPPSELRVRVLAGKSALESRTRAWLARPGSPFQQSLDRSIRDFVGSSDAFGNRGLSEAEATRNRRRLLNQLTDALVAASPLINIDESLVGLVHPGAPLDRPKLQLSSVPLASHPVEDELRALLVRAGVMEDDIEPCLSSDGSIKHIDITSTLMAPVSLLVVESLMRPIAERWFALDADGRRDFWQRRRAKPLDAFVPVSQAMLRCLVRGWFTGRLLGGIWQQDGTWVIWSQTQRGALRFAEHFLSEPGDGAVGTDPLPLVLEALALAYVDVSRSGSLSPLQPYIELRDLGRSQSRGALLNYGTLAPAFETWVSSGELDPAFSEADALVAQSSTGDIGSVTESDRLHRLEALCRESIDIYDEMYEEALRDWDRSPAHLSTAPQWTGLWEPHMRPALNDIATAAHRRVQTAAGARKALIA